MWLHPKTYPKHLQSTYLDSFLGWPSWGGSNLKYEYSSCFFGGFVSVKQFTLPKTNKQSKAVENQWWEDYKLFISFWGPSAYVWSPFRVFLVLIFEWMRINYSRIASRAGKRLTSILHHVHAIPYHNQSCISPRCSMYVICFAFIYHRSMPFN